MSVKRETNPPPAHLPPPVGHDLGIMFGFMAVFIISMSVYLVLWKGELVVWFLWAGLVEAMLDGRKTGAIEKEKRGQWQ